VVTFEYDQDGNLEEEAQPTFGYSFKYKFDKYGNWIERIRNYYELKDGLKHDRGENMHTYRIITYYPELSVGTPK
jgi:hypothetical protein